MYLRYYLHRAETLFVYSRMSKMDREIPRLRQWNIYVANARVRASSRLFRRVTRFVSKNVYTENVLKNYASDYSCNEQRATFGSNGTFVLIGAPFDLVTRRRCCPAVLSSRISESAICTRMLHQSRRDLIPKKYLIPIFVLYNIHWLTLSLNQETR